MWRRRCTNIVLVKHLFPEADNLILVFVAGPDCEVDHEDHGPTFQDALDDGEVLASGTFEDLVVLVGVLGDHRLDHRVYVGELPRLGGANLSNVVLVKYYLQVLWLNIPDRHTWLSVYRVGFLISEVDQPYHRVAESNELQRQDVVPPHVAPTWNSPGEWNDGLAVVTAIFPATFSVRHVKESISVGPVGSRTEVTMV